MNGPAILTASSILDLESAYSTESTPPRLLRAPPLYPPSHVIPQGIVSSSGHPPETLGRMTGRDEESEAKGLREIQRENPI